MYKIIAIGLSAWLLAGCGSDVNVANESEKPGGYTVFDKASGNIPYPNNILFSGSEDGTLNIPYDVNASDAGIKAALNTLDGFSTTSPITVSVTGDINPDTLASGVHLYETSTVPEHFPAVAAISKTLTFGVDYVATMSEGKVVILPTKALKPNTNYLVVLDKKITDTKNRSIESDPITAMINATYKLIDATGGSTVYGVDDATAQGLEGLRQLNQANYAALLANGAECNASTAGVTCDNIVMAWTFYTQSIGKVNQAFSDENSASTIQVVDTNATSKDILLQAGYDVNASMYGIAEVYAGALTAVPYYLHAAESIHSPDPLTKYFDKQAGTDLPVLQSMQNIPILITVPKHIAKPAAGWPVVIFQHGITSNRTALLPISEALANAGYAAVAIDLPLHGLTTASPLKTSFERTFDLDLMDNNTSAPTPDGITDTSGAHYINLVNPLVSRDNVLQSTSDLITLVNSLSTATTIGFDDSNVAFVGHSLGTIASFGFLSHRKMQTVTLAMPGSGIAQLLNNSQTFGPIIEAGLASKGIVKGSAEYASFMLATQTLIDDADPINYAKALTQMQDKVYAIEVIGDAVIPNAVATAPLSGSNPLLNAIGATDINTSTAPGIIPATSNVVSRFTVGDHSSILSPEADVNATIEMQTQTASFVKSAGTIIQVNNPSIIQQ